MSIGTALSSFWSSLVGAWNGFYDFLYQAWNKVFEVVAHSWATVLIFVGWFATILASIKASFILVAEVVGQFTPMDVAAEGSVAVSGGMLDMLALANTIMPLEEGIAMLIAYCTAAFYLTMYRLFKSWIPTLS